MKNVSSTTKAERSFTWMDELFGSQTSFAWLVLISKLRMAFIVILKLIFFIVFLLLGEKLEPLIHPSMEYCDMANGCAFFCHNRDINCTNIS